MINVSKTRAQLSDLERAQNQLADAERERAMLNNKNGAIRVTIGENTQFTIDVTQFVHWQGANKVIEGRDMLYLALQKLANARVDHLKEKVADMEHDLKAVINAK